MLKDSRFCTMLGRKNVSRNETFPLRLIPVSKPSFGTEECRAAEQVIRSGWVGTGPETEKFEKEFAEYIGVKHAVALNSCTAALHLAMNVLNVENAEVITSPITFISTNHAILYNRARPVFCDVYEDTLNINVDTIEQAITPDTKAIIVVHYGGHSCCMDEVMRVAKKNNLKVIEDCAHACGGCYKDKKLGSIGDIGCFSFHATKNLSTGDGGMITTNDGTLCEQIRKLRWLGISSETWQREAARLKYDWHYNVEELGFKYHMNDIAAAIGRVQLRKVSALNARRRIIASQYAAALEGIAEISLPVVRQYASHVFYNFVIKLDKRDELNIFLQQAGISTGVHYFPNHLYKLYSPFYKKLPVAESLWKRILSLPMFPDLKDGDVITITAQIHNFFHSAPYKQ